ncbi:MAG: hypothetical protein UW69_C0001G0028 [Microgenomates group bacterium GW2011_GWA2_44_7]|nr:MAG: hypothetical protein UW69_C0001G0028 [Microgenomates group bacterium GW2011_GWA2_44_7]
MISRSRIFLGTIIVLALILRLGALDRYPAGFNADEANQGYSAYSLLQTGKDEWGETLPLSPRTFGDYKAPLYTYLTVPSIALFGLNVFATRLPAAILGTLTVLITYLLVISLFDHTAMSMPKLKEKVWLNGNVIGLVAALLLAISPWHVQLSRGAFEANLPSFFIPLVP